MYSKQILGISKNRQFFTVFYFFFIWNETKMIKINFVLDLDTCISMPWNEYNLNPPKRLSISLTLGIDFHYCWLLPITINEICMALIWTLIGSCTMSYSNQNHTMWDSFYIVQRKTTLCETLCYSIKSTLCESALCETLWIWIYSVSHSVDSHSVDFYTVT